MRPDADSHDKQQLTVQRARKAAAVKSVEEHNARSFVSERQKREKPDLLSKTSFFPNTQGDSLHGTAVFSTNAATGRYQTTKSMHVVLHLTHSSRGLWSAGCRSALCMV